jgi:hypothetical protein
MESGGLKGSGTGAQRRPLVGGDTKSRKKSFRFSPK